MLHPCGGVGLVDLLDVDGLPRLRVAQITVIHVSDREQAHRGIARIKGLW